MEKPTVHPPKDAPEKERALVENASDAGQVRTARKRKAVSDQQRISDLKTVLELPAGRRLYREYLAFCRVFQGGRVPTEDIQFNEGMRNVGLKMLLDIEQARPDLISIMRDV